MTRRVGVQVTAVYWCPPGEPPSLFFVIDASRVALLAQALNEHLAGNPPGAG